jgi:UrcA family protein
MAVRFPLKSALLASALGALLLAPAAQAQDNGRYDSASYSNDNESVTVYAPQFRTDPGARLNGIPGKVSLSRAVSYSDLDLRNPRDAHELRARVADTARDICDQLADAYPGPDASGTSCFRTARADAMRHVDAAIRDARDEER